MIAFSRRLLLVSLHGQNSFLYLIRFFSPDEIPKIKICHMLAKLDPEVIEGIRRLIAVNVLDSEEADEDDAIYHDGDALD